MASGLTILDPPIGSAVEVAEDDGGGVYDPLHDDAQAMALLKRFRLDLTISAMLFNWSRGHGEHDLNRAICERVANMPKAKP